MTAPADQIWPAAARPSARLGFRTEIEGLRGIAVLLVLLYHASFSWIEGGYIGVDVFFVISGYLITRLLLQELENETFSARNFYVRRMRRLIPALLVTVLVTMAAGVIVLSPAHLEELGTSSIFAALSISNFHFAFTGGYFETSSKIKPLLHTWSLSVEEQFYLVWPLTLWMIFLLGVLRRHLFLLIGLALVAGLIISEYWIARNPAQAYFLLPFRAYQLLAGALAVWAERRLNGIGPGRATVLVSLGIVFVVGAAVLFDEATPFPGLNGAIPALGGFLIVAAGSYAPLPAKLLSVAPLMWLGRISYSVYLAHWPVVVYARYLSPNPFSLAEKWLLCAASILVGLLLYYGVEARFRLSGAGKNTGHNWRETGGVAVVCGVALAMATGLRATDGLQVRMDLVPEKQAYAEAMEFEFLREYGDGLRHEGTGENGKSILIFGDSMMQNYIPALLSLPEIAKADVTIITRGGCPMGWASLQVINGGTDLHCRDLRDRVFADTETYDLAFWGQSWSEYDNRLYLERDNGRVPTTGGGIERWRAIIQETNTELAPRVAHFVVFGPQVTVENVPPILSRIGPITDIEAIPREFSRMKEARAEARDLLAKDFASLLPDAVFIDPDQIVCPAGTCTFADGSISYYFDPIHHTTGAKQILAQRINALIAQHLSW